MHNGPLGIKAHLSQTLKLALPVTLGQIGHIITNMSDTAMLGQYDTNHLAGAAFATNVFIPFMVFIFGLSMGLTPLVSSQKSKKNNLKIGSLYFHGMRLYTVSGVAVCLILLTLTLFLNNMGQEPIVAELAKPYFIWLAFSIIPVAIFQHMKQFSEGMANTKLPMLVSVYANLLNIIFNYFLIFGFWIVPPLGIVGAGIATFISRCLLVVIMLLMMNKNSILSKLITISKNASFNYSEINKILKISLPIGIQFCFEVTAFAMAAILIGTMGKEYLTAHEIAIRIAAISYLTASGIGSATTIRIGEYFGVKNFEELKKAALSSFGLVLILMVFAASSFYLFRYQIPLIMIDSSETVIIQHTATFLILAAVFQFSDGAQVIALGILRGIQDVKFPTFITLAAYWIIALPLAYYLGFKTDYGAQGVWYALIVGLTISAILLISRFIYTYKKEKAIPIN